MSCNKNSFIYHLKNKKFSKKTGLIINIYQNLKGCGGKEKKVIFKN